jgi:hypothetical protein
MARAEPANCAIAQHIRAQIRTAAKIAAIGTGHCSGGRFVRWATIDEAPRPFWVPR